MLDTENYLLQSQQSKFMRSYVRGMTEVIVDFMRIRGNISSVLELGVAGGGSHEKWMKAGADVVGGVELFDPEDTECGTYADDIKRYEHFITQTKAMDTEDRIKVLHGLSSYGEDTARLISEHCGLDAWDIVYDDSCTDPYRGREFVNLYKPYIKQDGLIFTVTPNGHCTSHAALVHYQDWLEHMQYLASCGMKIIDCSPYGKWDHPNYNHVAKFPYLGVYANDWTPYVSLLEKYKKDIAFE